MIGYPYQPNKRMISWIDATLVILKTASKANDIKRELVTATRVRLICWLVTLGPKSDN